jgi:hypothetical protein
MGVIGWQRIEVSHYRAKSVTLQSAIETIKSQAAADLAAQRVAAAAKERAQAASTAAAERAMLQDFQNDKDNQAAVIAKLRAGTLRLRHQWTCPSVSATATAPSKPDADAALREQDASDLVRLAADADAQIRALQAVLMGERQ